MVLVGEERQDMRRAFTPGSPAFRWLEACLSNTDRELRTATPEIVPRLQGRAEILDMILTVVEPAHPLIGRTPDRRPSRSERG